MEQLIVSTHSSVVSFLV